MENKILNFNSAMTDYVVINPEFARVKVYVCYAGKNRNRSEISKEVLDKMSKSIYGIPVVAEYDKENNCFKGHGGKLEISDDGIDFIQTTIPYGFVDPNTPVFYEEVTELDGMTKNNYLCCYAYLWYKRYPEVESVLKNQDSKTIGQSMEIEVSDYEWSEDDYCVIKDGHFSALAMLGVEPCFEGAKVTSKFSKSEIEGEYQDMIHAFKKYTLSELEGGKEMEENKEFETEEVVVETAEEFDNEESEEKEDFETKYNEVVNELNEVKAKFTDLTSELEGIKTDYSALESEIKELREYKANIEFETHKIEVDTALEVYSELEAVDGYSELTKDKYDCDLESLIKEIKVFAFDNGIILGKKAKKNFAKETIKIPVVNKEKEVVRNSAWNILDKYVPNK